MGLVDLGGRGELTFKQYLSETDLKCLEAPTVPTCHRISLEPCPGVAARVERTVLGR
jgi:hypothetical protein